MNNADVYRRVTDIHDHVMGLLRAMQIAPFPAHYKKYFDQLFLEIADEKLRKEQEDAEHKVLDSSKEDVTKYLDIAKRSVMTFVESHADMATAVQGQKEYIDSAPTPMFEQFVSFLDGLSATNDTLTVELDKAQEKIGELTTELNEALATLTVDPLTKVGNRSAFLERMEAIVEAGEDKKLSMVLLMFDVDNFKFLNEEHGSVAGDRVLYFIAQTIKSMIRDGDRIYRYGGEEFTVVLTRCDGKQAHAIADKIREKIEQSKLLYMGMTIHVTISVGVTVHHRGDTLEKIMGRVQEALYCAKKSDKNCTFLYDW